MDKLKILKEIAIICIVFTYCISIIIDSYIKLREFICKSKNHPKAKKGGHKNWKIIYMKITLYR